MNQTIKDLCRIAGIIEGEIKTAPMSNEDESEEVTKLIRAKHGVEKAISEIQDFIGTKEMQERRKAQRAGMRAIVIFKEDSPFSKSDVGLQETFEDVVEIHYRYQGSPMVAIEMKTTGYTYELKDIDQIEIFNK